MRQILINEYLAQLDLLKKVGGTQRKSVVREAFKGLLKGWASSTTWSSSSSTSWRVPPRTPGSSTVRCCTNCA
ncbi:MAG: hypothetical protein H7337_25105 [Rhizobacter sp.]|nr:hypothetical protein [Rhizobacter sp.]